MDPTKCLNKFVQTETEEVGSVVCEADSSSSLVSKSWKFTTTDGTDDFTYQPYYVVDAVGADPTDGGVETTKLIARADSSSDLASTYFKIHDGPAASETDHYVYHTVAGTGYDPGLGQYEKTLITLILDTAGNLDGKYFSIYTGADQQKYVWYSKDADTTDPNPGTVGVAHGIKVSYTTADTVETITRLTANAINDDIIKNNDAYFTALKVHSSVSTAQVCTVVCVADVGGNLNNTWFTFGVPTAANTASTGQTKYCVWIDVGSGGTAPTLLNHTMVEVDITADDTANTIATAVASAIDALTGTGAGASTATVTITNTYKGVTDGVADGSTWRDNTLTGFTFATTTAGIDPGITVLNDQTGNPTTAVNGDIPAGTAFSVLQAGVDALNASGGALEDYTLLTVIPVDSADDTDNLVNDVIHTALNATAYTSAKTVGAAGYQECGLSAKTGTTETGLAGTTQYYVKVNIDDAGVVEFDFTTAADTTFAGVIALLDAAVTGTAWSIVSGDLRCSSNAVGAASTIAVTAGTTGTDFLVTLTGYTTMDSAVAGVAPYVTLTHPTKGNCTNSADGDVGGAFTVSTPTAGVDPTTATITSIAIAIAEDATAAAVGTASKTAIDAVTGMDLMMGVGLSTATLTLTNRWGGVVADVADVDTSWASISTTTAGSAVVQTHMGQNLASGNYFIRPPDDEVWYIRQINFTLSDGDCTNAGAFGELTALTNGLNIQVCEVDGTVIKTLAATVKTNLMLCALGTCVIEAGTNDTLAVYWNLVDAFGQEVAISGNEGEYLEVDINDNLSGIVGFYALCQGHIKDTLGA